MGRLTPVAVLLALTSVGAAQVPERKPNTQGPVVHEWGTFTSVAGADGQAVQWRPLDGPQDLPCFVERYRFNIKPWISGTVRMETPVLYFYAPKEISVTAKVAFRQGMVTEWYPRAEVTPTDRGWMFADPKFVSTIAWKGVTVSPGASLRLPTENEASHYYAARQTDAAPVVSGGQHEKFLFYRGVGGFQPPILAAVSNDERVFVTNIAGGPVGDVILFENRGGAMTYTVTHVGESGATLALPQLDGETVPPTAELEKILGANGLYPKEAKAMIATWRDSWFEEGARLIYIAPRSAVDGILPLTVTPEPTAVERVFVGRIELVTRTTKQAVKAALLKEDRAVLAKYGRFLGPIVEQVLKEATLSEAVALQAGLKAASSSMSVAPRSCS